MEWQPPAAARRDASRWHELADFMEAVSAARSEADAIDTTIEYVAATLEADYVSVLEGNRTIAASGPDENGVWPFAVSASVPSLRDAAMVVARGRGEFTDEEVVLVRSMARALSLTLGLVRALDEERDLRESLQERQSLLERLGRIQRSIVHRAPLTDVLHAICRGASDLVGDEVVGLRLIDPDDPEHLVMIADVGVSDDDRPLVMRSPLTTGVGGHAVLEGRLVVADDYAASPYAVPTFVASGLRAAMAAPVIEGRRVIGSLTVATAREGRAYSQAEQDVLLAFAEHASLALNDARTVDALHSTLRDALHQATHDPLTSLPNRSIVFEHLEALLKIDVPVALLFIDIDRFKAVNDSLGHDVGDGVLRAVADRFRAAVRPSDLVGRLAGDEFVVVCSGLHGQVDALGLADRLAKEVTKPISVASRDVVVTASIGIAQSASGRPASADELLRDADMAMYRAKERGRDRVEVFGRNLRTQVRGRLDMEHALRRAVANDEFRVAYQPVVDLRSRRPMLVEALVRWERDGRQISPGEFIPVAEETGIIVPIGSWVLREACAQVAAWRRDSPLLSAVQVSVNVSMRQFADDAFVGVVRDTLRESGLDPSALWLEVTESMLLDDADHAIETLLRLKRLDVHLSIDDFGTGYSSLAYLRRFPVDVLKIDRSFVKNLGAEPEESAILSAIVALGTALGVGVVAEGIETVAQFDEVFRLGVPTGQGYYFCRPAPADAVAVWLTDHLTVTTA